MARKFNNKYRIDTTRLQNWDYAWIAAYFVTINTLNRVHYFGEVVDGQLELSGIGEIAYKCWNEIPEHFPFVKLGAFIVMPDHVHGIIIIDKPEGRKIANNNLQNIGDDSLVKKTKNQFGPQSQNLASIVRGYKVGVTKNARLIDKSFKWQRLYWDHIITEPVEYMRIEKYILNNPRKYNK